jgi:anthranilate phosphoribosyltransferase
MLTDTVPAIRKLARGESLSSEETRQTLNVLMKEEKDQYFMLAFAIALMAKGPTVDELKGFVLSYQDSTERLMPAIDVNKLIDISGTGGDKIKTINVGTVASFILAAGGLVVGKQSTRGYTGATGSRDMFLALGINVPLVEGDPKLVQKGLEEVGLYPFYYPSFSKAHGNRVAFFNKLREIGLTFVTPWHLTSWVFNPLPLKYRLYGMFDDRYLVDFARLFQELGYTHVLVVHGIDGLDEVSSIGKTKIAELINNKIKIYTVSPKDLGIETGKIEDIRTGGADQNVLDLLRVLYNHDMGSKTNLVAVNAGAAFYAAKKANSLKEGTLLAKELIANGSASAKLEQLVDYAGDRKLLDSLLEKIK